MEIKKELLEKMISQAEEFNALAYAVPVSMIIWLIFNSIWFNVKRNYLIISLLVWSVLGLIFITGLAMKINLWLIFFVGIPAQIIILLWSNITKSERK